MDLADFPLQRAALPREPPPGPREAVGAGGVAAGRGRRPRPAALLRRGRVPRVERPRPQQRRRRRRRVVVALAQAVGGARRRRPAERRERHVLGRRRVVAVGVEAEGLGRGLEVPPGPRVGGRARRRRELVGLRVAAVDDEAGAAEEAAAPRRLALAPRRVERERGDARRGDAPLARAADREPHVDRAARGVDGRHLGEAALEVLAHARQRRRHDERAHGERRRRRGRVRRVRRRLGRVRWRLGCVRLRIRRGVGAHVRLRGRLVGLRGRLVRLRERLVGLRGRLVGLRERLVGLRGRLGRPRGRRQGRQRDVLGRIRGVVRGNAARGRRRQALEGVQAHHLAAALKIHTDVGDSRRG